MKTIEQLNIPDPELKYRMSIALKGKYQQINSKTIIEPICESAVVAVDHGSRLLHDRALRPHHENFRDDIKAEIRSNLNSVINDKNYLMKIADKYYCDKLNHCTEKVHQLEYIDLHVFETRIHLFCFYLPENDTLYVHESKSKFK